MTRRQAAAQRQARARAMKRRGLRPSGIDGEGLVVVLLRIGRVLLAFLGAVAGAYSLGAILATEDTLSRIDALGLPITLHDHLTATAHDLVGLAPAYLPLIAIALGLALVPAASLSLVMRRGHAAVYMLAGFVSLIALQLIVSDHRGVPLLAATRQWTGLLAQGLAGAAGMYLFFVLTGQAHRRDRQHVAPRRGAARDRR
jgi:hypothetical protein